MELELEPSDAPMPRSRPVKRLSDGELAELRAHLIDLLDRGWIQHSTAGHAAAVVFARKPDGSWRFCYDSRGLNAITRPAVEPSTHCSTHAGVSAAITSCGCGRRIGGRRAFGRRLAAGPVRVEHGAVWSAGGILTAGTCHEPGPHGWSRLRGGACRWPHVPSPKLGPSAHPWRGPGGLGSTGPVRARLMDDCLVHSPTLEQHLPPRRRGGPRDLPPPAAQSQELQVRVRAQELGFRGHRLSKAGVLVDPRKVQSIVEWATPTPCAEVRRFTGLANYYRRFVEGYAELAAPLTARGPLPRRRSSTR